MDYSITCQTVPTTKPYPMRFSAFQLLIFFFPFSLLAQENATVSGTVLDMRTKAPISGVMVAIEANPNSDTADNNGQFKIIMSSK